MINKRLVTRLDIKSNAVVKGIHLEGLRALGNPTDFASLYYREGIDEIVYMDVVASLYQRNSLKDLISSISKEIFVPLSVGGGIRTESDVRDLLNSGADKVIINTAAVNDPNLISRFVKKFGSSTIVVAIESIFDGSDFGVFVDNGREYTGKKVKDWVVEVQERGAGEIILTSVDNEGTGLGIDKKLLNSVSHLIEIPFIYHGGIGSNEHLLDALLHDNIDAVCASSIFHYDAIKRLVGKNDFAGNDSFLKSGLGKKNISSNSVIECKQYLKNNGVKLR